MRTRNAIARAVIQLGQERGVDRLTVRDVARAAGVSRSTFYSHFESLEDYLERSFANMLEMHAAHGPTTQGQDLLPVSRILAHVSAAPRFVAAVSRSKHRPAMFRAGEKRLAAFVEGRLAVRRPELASQQRATMARFIAAGFLGMLRQWMEMGMRRPAPEFDRDFSALVERLSS